MAQTPVEDWRAVVSEELLAYADEGLPEVSQDDIDDFLEAMELAESGGQMGNWRRQCRL